MSLPATLVDVAFWLVRVSAGAVGLIVAVLFFGVVHVIHRIAGLVGDCTGQRHFRSLQGEVIIVTGGRGGFGAAVSRRLAAAGAVVFAVDITPPQQQPEQREGPAATGRITQVICDITNAGAIKTFIDEHIKPLDRPVYALVNNAGIFGKPAAVSECSDDNMRSVFDVNFFAPLALTRELLPFMMKSGARSDNTRPFRSRVVNVTSCAGIVTTPGMGPYTCSKFALEALSDCLRQEMPGVLDVAMIEPHFASTGIFAALFGADASELARSRMAKHFDIAKARFARLQQTRGGMMTADFVADVIVRAISERSPQDRYMVCPNAFVEGIMRLLAHAPNYFHLLDAAKRADAERR